MSLYNIQSLLEYNGPSTRTENIDQSWITILDYKSTDENERVVALLLSSQGVPFRIDRPAPGWSQPQLQLYVIVPRDRLDDATAILAAATEQALLERLEGQDGMPGL